MKIMKLLRIFFICTGVIALHLDAVPKRQKDAVVEQSVVESALSNNDLLATIVENAESLVGLIKSGKRDLGEKERIVSAIDQAEKDISPNVKKLLRPHIRVIKKEIDTFFKQHKSLAQYDTHNAEAALGDLAAEVEKLVKNASEDVVAAAQQDLESAFIETEGIKSAAAKVIAEVLEQQKTGEIAPLAAAQQIVQQSNIIKEADKKLKTLAQETAVAVKESDAQVSYLSKFLAPFQAGYFSTQEEKEFAYKMIVKLEQAKKVTTNQAVIKALDDKIRQQKIITGEAWSGARTAFWGTVALVGAAGLGTLAKQYWSVPIVPVVPPSNVKHKATEFAQKPEKQGQAEQEDTPQEQQQQERQEEVAPIVKELAREPIQQSIQTTSQNIESNLPAYDPNELNEKLHNPELYALFRAQAAGEPISKNDILNFFGPNDVENLDNYQENLRQEQAKSPIWDKEWNEKYEELMNTSVTIGSKKEQNIQKALEPFKQEMKRYNELMAQRVEIYRIKSLIEQVQTQEEPQEAAQKPVTKEVMPQEQQQQERQEEVAPIVKELAQEPIQQSIRLAIGRVASGDLANDTLITLPSKNIIKRRLKDNGCGYFDEKMKLAEQLGDKEKYALGVAVAVDLAIADFCEKNQEDCIFKQMSRDDMLRTILQDHPTAIKELEVLKVIN